MINFTPLQVDLMELTLLFATENPQFAERMTSRSSVFQRVNVGHVGYSAPLKSRQKKRNAGNGWIVGELIIGRKI